MMSKSFAKPEKPQSTQPGQLLASAWREAQWIIAVWLVACTWSVGVCAWLGYEQPSDKLPPLVWGFPNWVFWGIIVPWLVATASSLVISQLLMTDEDLGKD